MINCWKTVKKHNAYDASLIDNEIIIHPSEKGPIKRRPILSTSRPIKTRCMENPTNKTAKFPRITTKEQNEKGNTSKHQCYVCGKTLSNLQRHLKEQHGDHKKVDRAVSSQGYRVRYCPLCEKKYDRLRDHLKSKHKIIFFFKLQ